MLTKILAGVHERSNARDAAALAQRLARACDTDLMLSAFQNPLLPFPLTLDRDAHRDEDAHACLMAVRSR